MSPKCIFIAFILINSNPGQAQDKKNDFRLSLINNSAFSTICTVLGNEKKDTVLPGTKKTIFFKLESDQISFYLNLRTTGLSSDSYQEKRIRILNTKGAKQITVTAKNQLQYTLTPEETTIAGYNPRLRTKNFWKLDSVIHRNAKNIAAAEVIFLSLCDIEVPVDTIQMYYQQLSPKIRTSAYGKRITEYLAARDRLNIGNRMDNFSLPDTTGRTISLNEMKSEYILLDFWFSNCGPCISSFPELRDLYAKTDRGKFEIMGISVDMPDETILCKNTIKKYQLPWINLNDARFRLARKLAIVHYPTKILLNKAREIILIDTDNNYENFYKEIENLVSQK